jgi:hypothetical protein
MSFFFTERLKNKKTPSRWKRGANEPLSNGASNTNSPFQKEGGAVSGDTRWLQAMRIFPW